MIDHIARRARSGALLTSLMLTLLAPVVARASPSEEGALFDAVRTALDEEGILASSVRVGVARGVVTLQGELPSVAAREHASDIVAGVVGVLRIENGISIRRGVLSDDRIRDNIVAALQADPTVRQSLIDVAVRLGVARLAGSVSTWPLRVWVGRVAGGVTGVREVKNDVRVSAGARWDPQLASDLRDLARWDVRLADSDLTIEATGGIVSVRGSVSSLVGARLVEENAILSGARIVVTSGLVVRPSPRFVDANAPARGQGALAIARAIKAALALDARVDRRRVAVAVTGDVATLTGEVDLLATKLDVLRRVRFVVGVHDVTDAIVVRPVATIPAAVLRETVRRAVETTVGIAPNDLALQVHGGRVLLRGELEALRQRVALVERIAAIEGVTEIDDRIEVVQRPGTRRGELQRAEVDRQLRASPRTKVTER